MPSSAAATFMSFCFDGKVMSEEGLGSLEVLG